MMTDKYIHQIIGDIIDSIREVGEITNITINAAGNSVAMAINNFSKNDVVVVSNSNGDSFDNIVILSADSESFEFSKNLDYNDEYSYSYKAKAPYYLHEKKEKANEILTVKDQSDSQRWQKYPLVLLIRPFSEDLTSADKVTADLRIAIVDETDREFNADQRYENVIYPSLEPIYDGLMDGLVSCNELYLNGIDYIQHRRDDECLIDKNPLPDYLDGILIQFINLPFKRKC